MSAGPRFSFLTPAYRTEELLATTIASVCAQTDPDWELIVVDNGMSDKICAIVASFADSRIRLVRQENRGYRGGVTAAAAAAQGAYLCVLDSDDLVTPDFTARMAAALRAHPDAAAVGCDAYQFLDGDDRPFGRGYLHSVGVRPPSTAVRLTVTDVLSGWVPYYTGAVRRDAWDAVGGYDPGIAEVDESVLVWLRLASRFPVLATGEKLAGYRVRADSLSRDRDRVDAFEDALINTFTAFAHDDGARDRSAAVTGTVRRLRFHQALRRARWALLDDDIAAARTQARAAWDYQRCPRAAAVLAAVTVAPRAARAAHPAKQRLGALALRAGQRLAHRGLPVRTV